MAPGVARSQRGAGRGVKPLTGDGTAEAVRRAPDTGAARRVHADTGRGAVFPAPGAAASDAVSPSPREPRP